ncbi:patatin-like phospholipase family protein [Sorangium sp. So ce448]|uniref:patatin-like phospholipase family protein n=1 Tax=Sorangium sp. So ce448 TaxID=3133314 RepID=UPI003F5EDA6E
MSDHDDRARFARACDILPEDPVALVLTGAGARGAYEAGFASRLLPKLSKRRPTIIVGTSAGSINAALLASLAHMSAEDASRELVERWQRIHKEMVLGPVWLSLLRAGAQYIAGLLGIVSRSPMSLLDTRPLLASLKSPTLIDWNAINSNINNGTIKTLAVATTESNSGRTKIFYQSHQTTTIRNDEARAIDYVKTLLSAEHVLASASIPVLFRPTRIGAQDHGPFYLDGGLRLNAPLAPALAFGAKGLVVISTDSRWYGASAAMNIRRVPTMQDHVLQLMRMITSDRMVEEVRVLAEQNEDNPTKERIPLIVGCPAGQDDVGSVAARVLEDLLRGTRMLNHIDLSLLYQLTAMSPYSRPDVLSYILFEPEFISAAMQAGIQDAEELISDHPTEEELWGVLCQKYASNRNRPATST